ncbi:MAG TPA: hypothetical protein VL403_09810 [Candidatus Kryptonia bacterium]|nr:hypothetical protein [Candidatus Kryptonia bacterium]
MSRVLGRYDAAAIHDLFADAGVLAALTRKGFDHLEVRLEDRGGSLPHIVLSGCKRGEPFLLLDACLGEAVVRPEFFARRGYPMERPVELAVIRWVREQDPTAQFRPDRPRLPLQRHPGLGVLRHAFRIVVRMAADLGKDGVASVPKFFHDAVIFHRSRLFLFLDGAEQGRFEALARDLRSLSLGDASLALVSRCVHEVQRGVIEWFPGYQVFPISPPLTGYFHSDEYAARVTEALQAHRFVCSLEELSRTREQLAERHGGYGSGA